MINHALNYGKNDFAVFPLHYILDGHCSCENSSCSSPGKHPMLSGGHTIASKNETQIRNWWSQHPLANIGIATGTISNLFVLDIDTGGEKTGFDSLSTLETKHGSLPATPRVRTGSGGEHFYFWCDDPEMRNSAGKIGQNIDVRANGGYVVAPPSTHISGNIYDWIEQ